MNLFRAIIQGQLHVPASDSGQFVDSLSRLRHVAQAGSTVIILSDFRGFNEKAQAAIGGLRNSLSMVAVQVVDPLERHAPPVGRYSLVESRKGQSRRVGMAVSSADARDDYAHRFDQHCQLVGDFFAQGRHHHRIVGTDQPLLDSASHILSRVR